MQAMTILSKLTPPVFMPQDTSIYADDLTNMTDDLPASFSFAGKIVNCAALDMGQMMNLEDVTKDLPRSVRIVVRKSLLPRLPLPEEHCKLAFPGSTKFIPYFIDKFEDNIDGIGLDLTLRFNQDQQPQ